MNPILKDGHNAFHIINILGFLFAFSLALPIYVNSTFVNESVASVFGNHISDRIVGILYALGSVVTIIGILYTPYILNRFGNYKTTFFLLLVSIALLFGFAWTASPFFIIPMFILYLAVISIIYLNFDILLENYSSDGKTGGIRGVFLTMLNVAFLISPAIAGVILTDGGYEKLYSLAALLMITVLVLLAAHFKDFKDPLYDKTRFWETFKEVRGNKNIYNIFMANVLLRFFYAWMVIYMPIYLHEHVGFAWDELGLIFTIMLLPFVLFELPAGRLADSRWGEKEILMLGFIVAGISTMGLVFINAQSFWFWAIALFVTRIGASLIEITTESYFFKQVDATDTNIISFFRNARPIAYLVAPILATILLSVIGIEYKYLFLVLGLVMFLGIRYSLILTDTR